MPDIHGTREELVQMIVRLTAENEKLRKALELVDRYFMSCASAWSGNDGRLMDKEGRPISEAADLNELCEEAAQAVAAIMRPEFKQT